jgi:hypothetical protein
MRSEMIPSCDLPWTASKRLSSPAALGSTVQKVGAPSVPLTPTAFRKAITTASMPPCHVSQSGEGRVDQQDVPRPNLEAARRCNDIRLTQRMASKPLRAIAQLPTSFEQSTGHPTHRSGRQVLHGFLHNIRTSNFTGSEPTSSDRRQNGLRTVSRRDHQLHAVDFAAESERDVFEDIAMTLASVQRG